MKQFGMVRKSMRKFGAPGKSVGKFGGCMRQCMKGEGKGSVKDMMMGK